MDINRRTLQSKKNKKEDSRGKKIHSNRLQIPGTLTLNVFARNAARPEEEMLQGVEKLAIEMKNIKYKMLYQRPETLFADYIFLSANMAEAAIQLRAAVQADLLTSFWLVGHVKFFLKVGTKPQ